MIEPQIIEKDGKPEYAVIPIAQWQRIKAMLDELQDIRELDTVLAKPERRRIPFEVTSAVLDGTSPIRAWRGYRNLDPDDLVRSAGIDLQSLSSLERKERGPTRDELERLAQAFGVEVDDLIDPPP